MKRAIRRIFALYGSGITDTGLHYLFRGYEDRTLDLIGKPIVWQAILRVAGALQRQGSLSAKAIEEAIGPALWNMPRLSCMIPALPK